MKYLLTILLFISPFVDINAQDSTKVNAPKIISKLKVGNKTDFDSKSIKFVKVVEDSRCPTGVSCMWAGEVKIVIGIYEGDALLEQKELIFGSEGINPDDVKEILTSGKKTIFGYNVSPYPTSEKPIKPSGYYLELLIKQK